MVVNLNNMWRVEFWLNGMRYYRIGGFYTKEDAQAYDRLMHRNKPGTRIYIQGESD